MTNHFHSLVWTDHRLAKVFNFNDAENATTLVHSTRAHEHLHHKANSVDSGHAPTDREFLERVAQSLAQAGAILIVGPGSAKTELQRYIEHAHPPIAGKISAVETVDHPSDGELLAHGRHFFVADDRMRSRTG
jgi:stalled ribosome rescue protein Dom34